MTPGESSRQTGMPALHALLVLDISTRGMESDLVPKHVTDLSPAEAEERRRKRQELYKRNPERQREYGKAYRERKLNPESAPAPARLTYSVQDYAEEWVFLTDAGMTSMDIINRSRPSKAWFKKHITSLVKYANCPGCGRKYLVAKSGTILTCGRDCPKCNYTEDSRVSRRLSSTLALR